LVGKDRELLGLCHKGGANFVSENAGGRKEKALKRHSERNGVKRGESTGRSPIGERKNVVT